VTPIDVLAADPPPPTAGRPSDSEAPPEPTAAEGAFCAVMEQALGADEQRDADRPLGPGIAGARAGADTGADADRAEPLNPLLTLPTELTAFADPLVEVVADLPTDDDDIDADAGDPPSAPAPSPTFDLAAVTTAGPTTTSTATDASPTPTAANTAASSTTTTISTTATDAEAGPTPAPSTDHAAIARVPSNRPAGGDEAPVLPGPRPAGAPALTQPEPASDTGPPASDPDIGASPTMVDSVVSATPSTETDRTTAVGAGPGANPPPRNGGSVAAPAPPVPDLPSPRTTEPPAAWRQVADALVGRAGGDTAPVTIELDPAELGSVRAEISMRDGALRVDLRAATGDAKAMLERAIGELRHDLHRLGMRLGHIEVHDAHGTARPGADGIAAQGDTTSGRSDTTPDQRGGSLARPRPAERGSIESRSAPTDADRGRPRPRRPTTQVDLNL
jgi:hypothetical protein